MSPARVRTTEPPPVMTNFDPLPAVTALALTWSTSVGPTVANVMVDPEPTLMLCSDVLPLATEIVALDVMSPNPTGQENDATTEA